MIQTASFSAKVSKTNTSRRYILGKKGLCQGQSHPPSAGELSVNTNEKGREVRHKCHVSTAVCGYLVGVDCISVVKPNPAKIDAAL